MSDNSHPKNATTVDISGSIRLQVTDYGGLSGLSPLVPAWQEMAHRQGKYFLDFDWFRAAVTPDPYPTESLRTVVVKSLDGRVLGILPLEQRVEKIRRVPFKIWALVGARFAEVAYLASGSDFLCREPELRKTVLRAALAHLARTFPRRSLLLLGRLPEGSETLKACRNMPKRHLYARGAVDWIPVDRTYEQLLGGLSRKFKASLRNAENRSIAFGVVGFDQSEPCRAEFPAHYEQFKQLEASGWKGKSGRGGALQTPQSSAQRRVLDDVFLGSTSLKPMVHRMTISGECVGALLALKLGSTLSVLKLAYDENFRRLSPGHLLLRDLLARCCSDPSISRVDMVSHTAWVGSWRPDVREHHWCYLPVHPAGALVPMALLKLPTMSS